MKNIIIGTAGHVDHGKTCLVKALTGLDTDRLEEEKRRGMTIELGFASFTYKGRHLSLVDVPGHNKLIKTMVAGATGMDMALLIIDASEGVMPQTREHYDILKALKVEQIILVLTKKDMVNEEQLEARIAEIKTFIGERSTQIPIIPISALRMEGLDTLKKGILNMADLHKDKKVSLFRMPIDRSFSLKGQGTVITGTILGGSIKKGDGIYIMTESGKIKSKVRGLHVHGEEVEEVTSGGRCAINLHQVNVEQLNRGDVVSTEESLFPTTLIDCQIFATKHHILTNNQRVRINIGTIEVIGKIKIMDADKLEDENKGYATIKLDKSVVTIKKDTFIIRGLSPVETIGGGHIISHKTKFRPRFKEESLLYFNRMNHGDLTERVRIHLNDHRGGMTLQELYELSYDDKDEILTVLQQSLDQGQIRSLENGYYIAVSMWSYFANELNKKARSYYDKYSFTLFINKEEFYTRYFHYLPSSFYQALITDLENEGKIKRLGELIAIDYDKRQQEILGNQLVSRIETMILDSGIEGVESKHIKSDVLTKREKSEVLKVLLQLDRIVSLGNGIYMHANSLKKLEEIIAEAFKKQKTWTVIELRDLLQIGRKRTIEIMEYFDDQGLTKRNGNHRECVK